MAEDLHPLCDDWNKASNAAQVIVDHLEGGGQLKSRLVRSALTLVGFGSRQLEQAGLDHPSAPAPEAPAALAHEALDTEADEGLPPDPDAYEQALTDGLVEKLRPLTTVQARAGHADVNWRPIVSALLRFLSQWVASA